MLTRIALSLSGRMARRPYLLWSALCWMVIYTVILLAFMAADGDAGPFGKLSARGEWVVLGLVIAVILACARCLVALTVKRLHDLGWSGWEVPGILATAGAAVYLDDHFPPGAIALEILLAVAALSLLFMPGQAVANAHGSPPK